MPRRSRTNNSDDMVRCPVCSGSGQVPSLKDPNVFDLCPLCGGAGRVPRGTPGTRSKHGKRRN